MPVSGHAYTVPGWGTGEVWVDGERLLAHDLPRPAPLARGGGRTPRDAADADRSDDAWAGWADAYGIRPTRSVRAATVDADALATVPANAHGERRAQRAGAPYGGAGSPLETLSAPTSRECADFVSDLCRRVAEHLAGTPTTYDDVDMDDGWCTPFQAALLEALRGVPWGDVVSYGELAVLAGRPRAARAAGAFCAVNRFALVVPCHRVVAASSIGGYGASGVARKRRLLALEGVEL